MKELQIEKDDAGMRLTGIWPKLYPSFRPLWLRNTFARNALSAMAPGSSGTTGWKRAMCCNYTSATNFFNHPQPENAYLTITSPKLHIVYEDDNILFGGQATRSGGTPV